MGSCSCINGRVSMKSELDNIRNSDSPLHLFFRNFEMHAELQNAYSCICGGNAREVRKISIYNKRLAEIDCRGLSLILSELKHLTVLVLYGNSIGDSGIRVLASALHRLNLLKKLVISHNQISDLGLESLSSALCNMIHLKELNLSHNEISGNNIDALCQVLGDLKDLETLNLKGNILNGADLKIIHSSLKGNSNMIKFDVDPDAILPSRSKVLSSKN